MANGRKIYDDALSPAGHMEKGRCFYGKRGKSTIFHVIFIVPPKTRCYNHGRNPSQKIASEFLGRFLCSGKGIF